MTRRAGWKDLTIGLVATVSILLVAGFILVYGRVGRLKGRTITVYVTTDAARGVISGTEVWLDGQKVGVVKGVAFQPPSVEPQRRLVMTLEVLDTARPTLRLDSSIDIRAGTSLIGDQVIYLSSGTARAREIADGDTIHGGAQSDLAQTTRELTLASRGIPPILANLSVLAAQLQTTTGTIGALRIGARTPELKDVRLRSTRLLANVFHGDGTLGRAFSGGTSTLRSRAALAMAQVDSIRALVSSNDHSLGRFRRDSTLIVEMHRVRDELDEVQRLAESPSGTIGRFRTDSVIVRNLHRDADALDSLFADFKKHPARYIIF